MDYEEYRRSFFIEPQPEQRFRFVNTFGVTLFFEDFDTAVNYYERALGPPGYVEGEGTKGWGIGNGWLTLLRGKGGNPRNLEMTFEVETAPEAERLQKAFIEAGGEGEEPSDQMMYKKVRFCPVVDPFGMNILIISQV